MAKPECHHCLCAHPNGLCNCVDSWMGRDNPIDDHKYQLPDETNKVETE